MTKRGSTADAFRGPALAPTRPNASVAALNNEVMRNPISGRNAEVSYEVRGTVGNVTANPKLFNYTKEIDPLAANDIDVARAFPRPASGVPKNGSDMIARKFYNFQSYRDSHNIDTQAGYLRPVFEKQGWRKLGQRDDLQRWDQIMALHRNRMAKSADFNRFVDNAMVPHSDHYYDMMYGAAAAYGIKPLSAADGIGPEQAAAVYAMHRQRA